MQSNGFKEQKINEILWQVKRSHLQRCLGKARSLLVGSAAEPFAASSFLRFSLVQFVFTVVFIARFWFNFRLHFVVVPLSLYLRLIDSHWQRIQPVKIQKRGNRKHEEYVTFLSSTGRALDW